MGISYGKKLPTNGLKMLLDAASPKSALNRKQSSNLLNDPHTAWADGTDSTSGYGRNGDAGEQSRAIRTDPWGGKSVTWRSTPDSTSGADGGWNSTYYTIDRNYTYRHSVWVRRHTAGTGGTFYMGLNPAPIRNDNNTVQGNPYFYCPSQASMAQDQWYLAVSHCFYQDYSGGVAHPDSGWWTTTGGKVFGANQNTCNCGGSDVRFNSTTTNTMHRTYHFYTTNTSSGLEWCFPRIDKLDGTEPSVYQLLKQGEGMWNDLSGNGNHGVIQDSRNVTWSSDYGGVFNLDATTSKSYITVAGLNLSSSDNTVIVASRYTGSNDGRILSGGANNWLLGHHGGNTEAHYAEGWIRSTGGDANENWGIHVATRDHSADHSSYWKNGTKLTTDSTAGSSGPNGFSIGRYYGNNSEYSNAQVGYVAAWDRELTDAEITSITNSLRSRYGI